MCRTFDRLASVFTRNTTPPAPVRRPALYVGLSCAVCRTGR